MDEYLDLIKIYYNEKLLFLTKVKIKNAMNVNMIYNLRN